MKRKVNHNFSSLSYTIKKISWKIATFHPSRYLIAAVLMGVSIFLLGGGIYSLINNPPSLLPIGQERFIFFYPYYLHEQLLTESMVVMILYALGSLGLWLIYMSTRYTRNLRQVSFILGIGVVLLLIAFIAIEGVLYWKLNFG